MSDKFDVTDDVKNKALDALEAARDSGKTRKGTNEVTKAVERGNAKLVYIGGDVEPPEIVMHLPMLCNEKNIPHLYLPKADIGDSVGIHVPTAAACIIEEGKAKDLLPQLIEKIKEARE